MPTDDDAATLLMHEVTVVCAYIDNLTHMQQKSKHYSTKNQFLISNLFVTYIWSVHLFVSQINLESSMDSTDRRRVFQ